ncbi:hypothetical protein WDW37_08870 [Bdellovibrionota bacterium FG-1]
MNKSKKMSPNCWQTTALTSTVLAAMAMSTGCGSSATPVAATDLSLKGTFAATAASARMAQRSLASRLNRGDQELRYLIGDGAQATASIDYTAYSLQCATSDVPPVLVSGTIGSDGKFNIAIAGGGGKALNCNVLDATGAVAAALMLSDSAKTDMNGNPQVNGSPAFKAGTTTLGDITLDLTTGDATVPAAQPVDESGASAVISGAAALAGGTPFDPTGTWKITAYDGTLPTGVTSTCPAQVPGQQNNSGCNGPPADMNLYLNRLQGTNVSDSSTVYGLQMWQDSSAANAPIDSFTACGEMTGLAAADLAKAGVDLSSYGAKSGGFTFPATIADPYAGSTATITEGYKLSTAKAQFTMQNCVNKTYSGKPVFVCGPDTAGNGSPGGRYQASLGGGCVNAAGTAVDLGNNWSLVTWGSCTSVATPGLTGFTTSSCAGTYSGAAITCTNASGVFNDVDLATSPALQTDQQGHTWGAAFNFSGVAPAMTQGQLCSVVTDGLTKANCYAMYYEQHIGHGASGCLPRVDMDWTATDPAKFATTNFRPQSLVFMDKLTYSDANTASMLTEQFQHEGVQVQNSSRQNTWVNCAVVEKGGMSFTKVSDTKILATYVSSTTTSTLDQPACVATYGSAKSKFVFYLIKQ